MAENVFSGFAEGMQDGANWAAKQTELDLARRRVEQQQQEYELQKKQVNATIGKQYFNELSSAAMMAPGKTKSAYIKRIQTEAAESGITIDPTLIAGLDDPNYQPLFAKIKSGFTGVEEDAPDLFNDAMSALIPALGAKDVMTTLIPKMADNIVELQKAAAAKKQKALDEANRERRHQENLEARKGRQATTDSRAVSTSFNETPVRNEVVKMNSAKGVRSLLDEIKSGELVDSDSVRNQLAAMITRVELGGPGAVHDREAMGVQSLYTTVQGALGYMASNPTSTLPPAYIKQIETEVDALADRAASNYKINTDAIIAGMGDEDVAMVSKAVKRQQTFLKGMGYDPKTGERVKKETETPKEAPPAEAEKKKEAPKVSESVKKLKALWANPEKRKAIMSNPKFKNLSASDRAFITGGE